MRIKTFSAIRPPQELANRVASPPYDVVSTEEARAVAEGNPMSFMRVVRPEIGLPEGVDLHSDEVCEQASVSFARFQAEGYLVRDDVPSLYVYRQTMGDHHQRGIVAVCHVEDYEQNLIKKHENTRRAKEDDRMRHIKSVGAHAGPVFLTYRDDAEIDACVREIEQDEPLYDFLADDGIGHTVWKAGESSRLVELFASVPEDYVADGHHRTAAAARVAVERREANPNHTGEEEYNWFLAVLFPASQLKILAYNRVVTDLNGMSTAEFLGKVGDAFDVKEDVSPEPGSACAISMYLDGRWYGLSWKPDALADPVAGMDVSALQDRLLGPILGIGDPREDARIDFVGGKRGTAELEKRVNSGEMAVAFSMYPTSIEQLMAVSDAGLLMPPKSTWFEPKLRSGLLVHTLD